MQDRLGAGQGQQLSATVQHDSQRKGRLITPRPSHMPSLPWPKAAT